MPRIFDLIFLTLNMKGSVIHGQRGPGSSLLCGLRVPTQSYDSLAVTETEIAIGARKFSWVMVEFEELGPLAKYSTIDDADLECLDLGKFWSSDQLVSRNPPRLVSEPTAFPRLGDLETCQCWMIQEASKLCPREQFVIKLLFENWRELGAGLMVDHEGREGRVLTTTNTHRVFLVDSVSPCGCMQILIYSATTCHFGKEVGLVGHQLKHHLTVNGAYSSLGKFELINIHVYDRGLNGLRDIDDDSHLPSCHHKADLSFKAYRGPRGAKDYIPLRDRLARSSDQVERKTQHNDWAEEFWYLVDIRIATYHEQFRDRVVGRDWHDCVLSAKDTWFGPYPESADATIVHTTDISLPKCVKRRYKSVCGQLARTAYKYGGKILVEKSNGAKTYQEWVEMDRRRYELADTISRSDLVASCSQTARAWLKSANAKHMLNKVVYAALDDPVASEKYLKTFNSYFVNVMKGKALPIPKHLILAARQNQLQRQALHARQLEARDARVYVPGQGLVAVMVESTSQV